MRRPGRAKASGLGRGRPLENEAERRFLGSAGKSEALNGNQKEAHRRPRFIDEAPPSVRIARRLVLELLCFSPKVQRLVVESKYIVKIAF